MSPVISVPACPQMVAKPAGFLFSSVKCGSALTRGVCPRGFMETKLRNVRAGSKRAEPGGGRGSDRGERSQTRSAPPCPSRCHAGGGGWHPASQGARAAFVRVAAHGHTAVPTQLPGPCGVVPASPSCGWSHWSPWCPGLNVDHPPFVDKEAEAPRGWSQVTGTGRVRAQWELSLVTPAPW